MASIELRTLKNKPAYYKITANITLNGRTIRKFSRFEFDPKTLKTAKQRAAAATAAAFEFEAKAQEEAERSLSGASKPFREVADEYIASTKAKLEPSALLRGNYDFDKNKANTSRNKIGYLKKMVDVAPWFAEKSISEITKEDCEKVIEAVKENGCVRSEYAVILPEYAAMKSTSYAAMVEGYDLSAYTAMKCFGGAAVTMKTAEEVSKILGVSVRDAFCIERKEKPLAPKTIREYVLFANQVLHFANERYHSVQAEFKKPEKGTRPRFVDCIHEDEVKKLMAEISKYPIQEQAIVLSLLNTGVRRAELAGLTWSDFNFRDCTVHVNKSLLVFKDFGYQHTTTKESNDRYIDVAPEYMTFMQRYQMKLEAVKRKAGRPSKENSRQVVGDFESADLVGQASGESGRQVQRFIRLNKLTPELMKMVDDGKLKTTPAVELSYLTPEEQEDFLSYMESEGCTPSLSQAQKLKEASKESVLTPEKIQHIMAAKPPSVKPRDPQLMIPVAKVERYFPKGFTSDQMQQVIVKLLENYARAHQHGSR
jgi:hypothetical protein